MKPVDSMDVTIDDNVPPDVGDLPFDRVRASYDIVAEKYSSELADEIVAKPVERGMLLAFAEVIRGMESGVVGDVGCGPGHISKHLASLGLNMVGYDISASMIDEARKKFPEGEHHVASMFALPVATGAWRGAVARYATLHCSGDERALTYRELARVIQPGGYLLLGFYVSAPEHAEGSVYHLTSWFGRTVDLDIHFVAVQDAVDELERAGFAVDAALVREPMAKNELPTRRCYILARR